ncbi:5'-methylthioadenosine/adenosylhomocysteine nucleosidase [Rhodoferax sp.]|uniref:5'-methylthioadenosine/adenosylhomocysteine nucleosidase n=1 Tax=Rhodoferax sp. TaxID=50421 RepID=UPI002ACE2F29|nr:5'-methylthioadenosine/adenosylhomocysteine nucleosidase [Rhodoferax sp.]MDZ7921823.1 5'-methylthioadenosine/adenosylhomocysteine nucleosidase [Rhodoferax sp.]
MPPIAAPIAILSALAEEQAGLLQHMQGARDVVLAGRTVWCGSLWGQPVVLALSRIGKVAAATTATALIAHLGVGKVVFTGVAGGVGDGVQVGDVVVGTSYLQHDMDASPLFPRYEIPLYGRAVFAGDDGMCGALQAACNAALVRHRDRAPAVHRGLIASGDRFVNGATEVAALVGRLKAAGHTPLAVEMEGAAVAQVCADYGVPFAAVRTISDRADDTAHMDFSTFVQDVASVYAQRIVENLLKTLSK